MKTNAISDGNSLPSPLKILWESLAAGSIGTRAAKPCHRLFMKAGACVGEAAEDDVLERWHSRERLNGRRNRDAGGTVGGKMVCPGGDRREGGRGEAACLAEPDRARVAGGQQPVL